MSTLDSLITSDLESLGEDSRRDIASLDDALNAKNMYRDDRPGAEARRNELAEERRVELAMMPLAMSHVFAHRVGRAAVGGVACLATIVIVAVLSDPVLLHYASWFVPHLIDVSKLETFVMLGLVGLLGVYVIAVWIAEAWFARRMRDTIRTGHDPYRDLDELARGPFEVARRVVQRVDGLSVGLFLAGTTALVLVLGYAVVIIDVFQTDSSSWVYSGDTLYPRGLVNNLDVLAVSLLGVAAAGFFVGRACHRSSSLLTRFGHWSTLGLAIVAGAVTAYVGLGALVRVGRLPSTELRYALALGTALCFIAAGVWKLLWWRRREHARIGE
ncbi:MAG TPA: hypothetical protein VIV11_29370 [Kofleriaceae bacterium]